ncbi:DUF6049 family protein [Microbacterium sp. CH12i]|uniref:DUF6049 family protein n=1 Tax=Microbacterium sp. CH12i TaxID=1479651 RepID=UPI001F17A174|nr:DUF6049 family protein [Microbacterium sp. CH12i]
MFALAAGLALAPQLTFAAPASAAAKDTSEGAVDIALSTGAHGVIQPGSSLTTTVTITNSTDEELSTGRVTVELNRTPLLDGSALASWLDSGEASGSFAPLAAENSDPVTASDSSITSVFTPASALGALADGVYPIRAKLAGATTGDLQNDTFSSQNITASSVLIVDSGAAAQVSVLVPITATPADGGLLTADELTVLTASDGALTAGALTAQLDGVAGTSAALAVDPLIPAAIRALGTAAPLSATDWLTRLDALPNERFALQLGDADATVQARAGLPELLAPLSLAPYLNDANFIESSGGATPSPTPSATPSGAPTEPVLPTNAELTALRSAAPGIVWPLGDVTTADLATFNEYLGTDVTTVLPSTSLAAYSSARVEVDSHDVLVMDAAASDALSRAAGDADATTREGDIAEGIAHLSFTRPQASLLVGLDRNETRTADALRETILSVTTIAAPVGLSELRNTVPASATLGDATDAANDAVTTRVTMLGSLLADEAQLTAFSSILDDTLVLRSPERLQLMRLIGVGVADTYPEDAAAHRTATTKTLNAVGVQPPSPIQLFTSAAPLPVWVRNDLPWAVNVTLTSTPSDARLDVRPTTEVAAQPASNTRVKVPVEARVGSGDLTVEFSLASPTGVPVGVDQSATVAVRAEWENIGLGILGGMIALLLILGIVRTVVRRRKDRDGEADAEFETDATPDESTKE